jgi:type IV pilus assembly protein PilC
MPLFQYEAMDQTGQEIKDTVEAPSQDEAQAKIREQGYFVTKISVSKPRKESAAKKTGKRKGKTFAIGGVNKKQLTTFTRQLSILQDAGLPILRALKILEQQSKSGALKNCLIDVCEEIESGTTLSEAMAKSPKAFDRLYVNMIKAGEAGGALEVILKRLAEFQERAESLKRKVKGAMVYPVSVITFSLCILTFILWKIVPQFIKIFKDFDAKLPWTTTLLVDASNMVVTYFYLIPGIPISIWLFIKLVRKFPAGRMGWDIYLLKLPIMGQFLEKAVIARTTRTLGTLVASGVPILEALYIARDTAGNAVFERLYQKVADSIRDGESVSKPLKEHSYVRFHLVAAFFWLCCPPLIGLLIYITRMTSRVMDDMVVNMVDVGEETGELDSMLYKVADTYDEEVSVLTESLMSLMEPVLIIFLGGMVGFIVISLFMPMIGLIQKMSG